MPMNPSDSSFERFRQVLRNQRDTYPETAQWWLEPRPPGDWIDVQFNYDPEDRRLCGLPPREEP